MRSFFRIIKFSFQDLARNAWLSIVTITILLLALFSINTLITVQVVSDSAITAIKDKVDISLYLNSEAPESEILKLKSDLESNSKVKSVNYISKTAALQDFRAKYRNNDPVLSALKELGKNPLSPSLIILPANIEESSLLINELKVIDSPIIESRDFTDNSSILNKISSITQRINEVGLFIILIFVLTSLLVVYNAIRVAIYTHRQEIEIERLVGASNYFIYMPYIFSSFLYSLISVGIIIAAFFPLLTLIQPYLEVFFTGYSVNILGYFINNFFYIFGLQFLVILFINIVATLIAVRRYANV
ncbi:MAG: permease-like cell division protein FtsX [Patescibacteria group bacterium]|jgi:cell division transport system permease protein|nr:permease-like cell division protein FtsX [Patescibacteria group bacterium]